MQRGQLQVKHWKMQQLNKIIQTGNFPRMPSEAVMEREEWTRPLPEPSFPSPALRAQLCRAYTWQSKI